MWMGIPKFLTTDQGSEFKNGVNERWCSSWRSSTGLPQPTIHGYV